MKHCEKCIWFGGYTGARGFAIQTYYCNDPAPLIKYNHYDSNIVCSNYKEKKMNWLTPEEIKVRSTTLKGALDVSIEKWLHFHDAPLSEINRAIITKETGIRDKHCGLCYYVGRDCFGSLNCSICPLHEGAWGSQCCEEWRKVSRLFEKNGHLDYSAVKKLINRLKHEQDKLGDKTVNIKEAYQIMQAAWVKLYNVEVGDIVRVLRLPLQDELSANTSSSKGKNQLGSCYEIDRIDSNTIKLITDSVGFLYPFFCLEFVKKAEPKIEITVKLNGKETSLKDISKETLLNIRENG